MKYFLYRIYVDDDESEIEIIVEANSQKEADFILNNDDTISHFSYLDELTEEEAYDSGLDIM